MQLPNGLTRQYSLCNDPSESHRYLIGVLKHYEFFSAAPVKSEADGSFKVKLASSGRIVVVPKAKSVVQALADVGVDVATSCEQGVCGTCLTRVLEGEPDHRDLFLTPEEQAANDQFTPCCSRSKSPLLVLDL